MLAALPELDIFRGVSIFRDPLSITIEENDIFKLCPRMHVVEHWDLDLARVIALAQEDDRVVWCVEDAFR